MEIKMENEMETGSIGTRGFPFGATLLEVICRG